MDTTCTSQDQRKSRSARISSALKQAIRFLGIIDQLCFPRECAHCFTLLKKPKQRLCPPCLDLLDPRSAAFGCKGCLQPLRELGEERTLEQCACKQKRVYLEVIYLEPADGILRSLIQSRALLEEKEISVALGAYLVQIAMESNQPLPQRILSYGSSQEEKLIKGALEKMLKIKKSCYGSLCKNPNQAIRNFCMKKLKEECEQQIVWLIGLKRNSSTTEFWKETLMSIQPKETILFLVSC